MLETHTIFHESLSQAFGAELEMVWCIAVGFCSPDRSITALARALAAVRSSDRARAARSLAEGISTRLEGLAPTRADDPDGFARLERDLGALERCDLALIAAIKAALREGLLVFEAHEEHVVERGGDALVRALAAIPAALERYHEDVSESLRLKHAASA
jgi:sulfite reductase (NADPH) flavoprotein alpha-component